MLAMGLLRAGQKQKRFGVIEKRKLAVLDIELKH